MFGVVKKAVAVPVLKLGCAWLDASSRVEHKLAAHAHARRDRSIAIVAIEVLLCIDHPTETVDECDRRDRIACVLGIACVLDILVAGDRVGRARGGENGAVRA